MLFLQETFGSLISQEHISLHKLKKGVLAIICVFLLIYRCFMEYMVAQVIVVDHRMLNLLLWDYCVAVILIFLP